MDVHLRVEFGYGATDAEAPGKDRVGFEFVGDDVLIEGVGEGDAGLVHLFGLFAEIVKQITETLNAFLAADRAMAGDKGGVLVPGCESLQRAAPAGHAALFVETGRVGVAEDKVASEDGFLLGRANDDVRARVTREMFDTEGEVAEVHLKRELGGIERPIGKG